MTNLTIFTFKGVRLRHFIYNDILLFMIIILLIYNHTHIFICPNAGQAFHPDVHRDETKQPLAHDRRE